MRFCSTRGGAKGATLAEALCTGYAPDGGLFVPEELPRISETTFASWASLDFPALALELLTLFVGDELPPEELADVVHGSYVNFSHKDIVPVIRLAEAAVVAELFHGPTYCFKDLGQQLLVRLLARFAERDKQKKTFLVSTTGDTGPAAMRAVADAASDYLQIVVFFPSGQISELQRRQMTTASTAKAKVATFEGGGDDMDLPLKRLSSDRAFVEKHGLCGINSYNLGRPLAQLAHFFWSYFRAVEQLGFALGSPVDLVIPGGALGNTAAAFMAKEMGLPVQRLICGVNQNDITHRTISKGEFHRHECMFKTLSDAINIQVPYNMERIFYYLTGEDRLLVKSWMEQMDCTSQLTLPEAWHQKMQQIFASARIDDDAMCEAMKRSVAEFGYLPCPHTAVALGAHFATPADVPRVIFATASPCKFQSSVTTALGQETWKNYEDSSNFPPSARSLFSKEETEPERFSARDTLKNSQDAWEFRLRKILGN